MLHSKLKSALDSLERIRAVSASTAAPSTPSPAGPSMAAALRSARSQGGLMVPGSPGRSHSPATPPQPTASSPLLASRSPTGGKPSPVKALRTPPLAFSAASDDVQQRAGLFPFGLSSAKPSSEEKQQEQQQSQVKLEHVALMVCHLSHASAKGHCIFHDETAVFVSFYYHVSRNCRYCGRGRATELVVCENSSLD